MITKSGFGIIIREKEKTDTIHPPTSKKLIGKNNYTNIIDTTRKVKRKYESKNNGIWKLATWNIRSINEKEWELLYEFKK